MRSTVERRIVDARENASSVRSELLETYRNYLRILAWNGIRGQLHAKVDASDLAQDTIIRAYERFPQFRGSSERELMGWLRTILAHRLTDLARKHSRSNGHQPIDRLLGESSVALGGVLVHPQSSPSTHANRRERALVVADALAQLAPDHREVILLRIRQELSWSEVGRAMGRSTEAARQLWVRALRSLKPHLEPESE